MTKEQLLALADEYATLTADTAAVTKARAALSDALDAVVRDAERYRWLKNKVESETGTDRFETQIDFAMGETK